MKSKMHIVNTVDANEKGLPSIPNSHPAFDISNREVSLAAEAYLYFFIVV